MTARNALQYPSHPGAARSRRGGYAAMLAMLFLVLFSTLALGFYSATGTATQVATNDQRIALAQTAAESGMDLMRYQLAQVKIPPNTSSAQVMNQLYAQLQTQMNGTRNLGSGSVGMSGNVINVPASGMINLDSAGLAKCALTITGWGWGDIVVKSTATYGTSTPITRSITMDFTNKPIPTDSFDYAIASKGQIVVSKGTITGATGVPASVATMMSDSAVAGAISVSGGTVGGDLNILSGATASITGGSVGGTSNRALISAQHVHVVDDPDFPTIDTTIYAAYATNAWVNGASMQQNITIPPGANPRFNANDTVQGIMYIRSPNTVTFRGDFKLQGFIVFENAGSSAVNSMSFSGNVSMTPVPSGAAFDTLRTVSGVAMMAPTAAVTMSGSNDSSVRGNIIVGSFALSGAASIYIDQGTLMTLNPGANSVVFNGSKSVYFTGTGQKNQPNEGTSYNQYYAPKPNTYQEILP